MIKENVVASSKINAEFNCTVQQVWNMVTSLENSNMQAQYAADLRRAVENV